MKLNYETVKDKIVNWRENIWRILAVVFLLSSLILVAIVLYIKFTAPPIPSDFFVAVVPRSKQKEHAGVNKLNGVPVKDSEVATQVFAVMVDNHPDSRPPVGLGEARLVYEAPVEGGLTRFMALYDQFQVVEKVGPVRSARPYFISWVKEYGDAMFLHSGGSPAALKLIKEVGLFDADEFSREQYFWRSRARVRPHNLFSSSSFWLEMLERYGRGRNKTEWQPFEFNKDKTELASEVATAIKSIVINYRPDYQVAWDYDITTGQYLRFINEEQQQGENDEALKAEVVLVQEVEVEILDELGRREIKTVGSGEARALMAGQMVRGSWARENESSRTRFYDKNNNELVFNPGVIWIQIVPRGVEVEVSS